MPSRTDVPAHPTTMTPHITVMGAVFRHHLSPFPDGVPLTGTTCGVILLVLPAHSMLPFLSRFPFPHSICQHFPSPLTRIIPMRIPCFFYVSPISISLLSCFQGICLALHGFSPFRHLSRQCGSFPSSPFMLSSASPWQRYGGITGSKGRGGHRPSHVKISTPYG